MKLKFMLIGLALALVLCISPVVAVSGSDFEIVVDESGDIPTYKYYDMYSSSSNYIQLRTDGTRCLNSIVVFKPHNIPGAPMMTVNTYKRSAIIYLPKSVDEWEIEYYSCSKTYIYPCKAFLKNAGVVNLNEFYKGHNWEYLDLELSKRQCISSPYTWVETIWWGTKRIHYCYSPSWDIPEV
jgi:hypothetical protein